MSNNNHFLHRPNHNPTGPKELITILSRERAPGVANRDMFVNQTEKATVGKQTDRNGTNKIFQSL